jgi:NAD(P)-dependent dehydrogenase (short-subunit alcohol dehydrogenase family)
MNSSIQHVVITGTATGIGHAAARLLAERGFHVFAAVRKPADVEAWSAADVVGIEPIVMDVTQADSIEAATRRVAHALGAEPLTALVNNAGITVTCPGWDNSPVILG